MSNSNLPHDTTCLELIMKAREHSEVKALLAWKHFVAGASKWLYVCSAMMYMAARLTIIILLFTCLRATPSDAYLMNSWFRFLPSIS